MRASLRDTEGRPLSYKQIGEQFEPALSEQAVKSRMFKMQQRAKEEKQKADSKRKSKRASEVAEMRGMRRRLDEQRARNQREQVAQ